MEESPAPWLIAEAIEASGTTVLWVRVSSLLGAVLMLLGALFFCV